MNGANKTGLNKREKILIIAAAALAIAVLGFQFVIIPLNTAIAEKRETYMQLDMEALELKDRLAREALTVQSFERAEAAVEELSGTYPERLPNEEIDRRMTRLCMASGLNPQALQIGAPAVVKVPGKTGERNEETSFCAVPISMSLSGDFRALRYLIDEVNGMENLKISKFTFNVSSGNATAFTVLFEMTMIDQ